MAIWRQKYECLFSIVLAHNKYSICLGHCYPKQVLCFLKNKRTNKNKFTKNKHKETRAKLQIMTVFPSRFLQTLLQGIPEVARCQKILPSRPDHHQAPQSLCPAPSHPQPASMAFYHLVFLAGARQGWRHLERLRHLLSLRHSFSSPTPCPPHPNIKVSGEHGRFSKTTAPESPAQTAGK